MKGRETKGAPAAADLLVCFPSRAHLTLMPKPICSPARSSDPNNHHHRHRHHHLHHHLKKSITRGSNGQASPVLWAKPKSSTGTELVSEPTSPKVTCAGQIKVRHKTSNCKSWQSVMEEIERMHNSRKQKKARPGWSEALGIKKDVMQFLTCLRNIRFDFRCFGSFHNGADITTDDEDELEEEEDDELEEEDDDGETNRTESEASRTVFSKWYMVLQEEQSNNNGFSKDDRMMKIEEEEDEKGSTGCEVAVPPANALMLMRCRSAPAKSWLEEKQEEEEKAKQSEEEEEEIVGEKKISKNSLKCLMEAENNELVVMRYDTDFYKISSDIAKETWVVGGIRDPFSRSRSWKR
ncbi:hypothetical protein CsatB_008378 [Cannabis sativa]|uniref:Uncharacterized protein n=1 Tax=Cannabis sativa TaxID=3483 RepID=A0A7J6HJP9_CANSA|nr:hypothetical protein F8388_019475 [Cannabis sativa]KAF4394849.1 hypothetical protein G4B88_002726 [Cannabis sativa]